MKNYLLSLIALFSFITTFAQDAQDTLVFDLSQQTQAGGYAQFPVYFLSDDVINAVDFSLRYNTVDMTFDSIIKLASYLNITTNEVHGIDTTVYFTSYSLQTITNDTPLVMIRFTPAGQICSEDLISVLGYLNGNAVSVKVIDCSTVGIAHKDNSNDNAGVYPNPATENVTAEFSLEAKSKVIISIHDITGKVVYQKSPAEYSSGRHKLNLNLSVLESGVYTVQIHAVNQTKSIRITLIR